jgi:hypothetical protein
MENDGQSLERVRVTSRKRVKHERRIVATKRGGLLVDPTDAATPAKGPKVPPDRVLAAIVADPGLTYEELGAAIGVSSDTASRYTKSLGDVVDIIEGTNRKAARVFPSGSAAPHSSAHETAEQRPEGSPGQHRSTARTDIGAAVRAAVHDEGTTSPDADGVPDPDGGLCPRCGAGPFLVRDYYERHWADDHAAATKWSDPPELPTIDEDLAERATDDDGEAAS